MKNLFLEMGFENQAIQILYGKELIYISRLYSQFISDIKIKDLRKISIELTDSPEKNYVIPTHKLIKVCLIYSYFNRDILDTENSEAGRYKIILDLILKILLELSEKFFWSKTQFEEAYKKVIETEFKNEFILIPSKFSKDKKFGASIIINCTKEFSTIILELSDKKQNEIRKIEIIKLVSFKDEFSDIIHKLKWINNENLIISNKDEEINFKFFIRNEVPEMFLTPKRHDEKYLMDELKLLNPDTSKEEFLKINNKKLSGLAK